MTQSMPQSMTATPLRLRVLTGPLAGADAALREDGPVSVGRGFRNEVVLRDPSVGEARVELRLDGAAATLHVTQGAVRVLGGTLGAGEASPLPPFVPVWIGGSAFAYGEAGAPRWAEAEALAEAGVAWDGPPVPASLPGRFGFLRGAGLGLCAAAILSASALAALRTTDGPGPAARVTQMLEQAGFDGLAVAEDEDGVLVTGTLATDARRAELRQILADLDVITKGEVRTGEATARTVAEIFRADDVPATARYEGGAVIVSLEEGHDAEADRIEGLRRRALNDLPQLADLVIEGTPAARPGAAAPFTAQVASLVAGPSGYVLTRDGARYFVGAPLPTGGHLLAIGEGAITVREDGATNRYVFKQL